MPRRDALSGVQGRVGRSWSGVTNSPLHGGFRLVVGKGGFAAIRASLDGGSGRNPLVDRGVCRWAPGGSWQADGTARRHRSLFSSEGPDRAPEPGLSATAGEERRYTPSRGWQVIATKDQVETQGGRPRRQPAAHAPHHGSGRSAISRAMRRAARPRCEIASFSAEPYWPNVRRPGRSRAGSNSGS